MFALKLIIHLICCIGWPWDCQLKKRRSVTVKQAGLAIASLGDHLPMGHRVTSLAGLPRQKFLFGGGRDFVDKGKVMDKNQKKLIFLSGCHG